MLDTLPAVWRHAVLLCAIAPVAALAGVPLLAIISAGGVVGLDWHAVGITAINASAVSFATGGTAWITSYVTPLTRQYGVGRDSAGEPDLDRGV